MGNEHPDFITPAREMLERIGLPYVIENVPGAPLEDPIELCGAMFGLGTYRHRLFETNFYMDTPEHPKHTAKTTKMGRKPVDGEMMHVVGNFSGVEKAKKAMGIDWMNRDGLRESIPPAYAEYVGHSLMASVMSNRLLEAAA
jgi:DNA (cytosine-5)-methyltransferase 1